MLYNEFKLSEYRAVEGDDLMRILYRLYGSNDSKYIRGLYAVNSRCDWDYIKANEVVYYVPKNVIDSKNLF